MRFFDWLLRRRPLGEFIKVTPEQQRRFDLRNRAQRYEQKFEERAEYLMNREATERPPLNGREVVLDCALYAEGCMDAFDGFRLDDITLAEQRAEREAAGNDQT